jgi:hypothetical protein
MKTSVFAAFCIVLLVFANEPSGQISGAWNSMGQSPGTNGTVNAIAVDGQGVLYIGGDFTRAGGYDATNVARWDGAEWQPMGEGRRPVAAIVCDQSGVVYAGGKSEHNGGPPTYRDGTVLRGAKSARQ